MMSSAQTFNMSVLLPELPNVREVAAVPQRTTKCEAQSETGKPRFPQFQRLPTEIVVLVMWHTRIRDLRNMIKTGKSVNQVFRENKMSIFKRVQICQFPEFSGWFGDLPGFDGSILGKSRTFEQVQCLRRLLVCSYGHRAIATPSAQRAAQASLYLLERHGGWDYLYFLQATKDHMEGEAKMLWNAVHVQIPPMSKEMAKSTILCLSRMSWRGSRLLEVLGEEYTVSDLPDIVKGRLKSFEEEPQIVQKIILTTLELLVCRLAKRLDLPETALSFSIWYCRERFGISLTVTEKQNLHNLTSEILAQLLLQCCFTYDIGVALQLCEEPVKDSICTIQRWIQQHFRLYCMSLLRATTLGTAPRFSPHVFMGSLWAKGLEFPTRDLFKDAINAYLILRD
ncbi:hypothetical protein BDR22DRAFT_904769 [Usnea florida]